MKQSSGKNVFWLWYEYVLFIKNKLNTVYQPKPIRIESNLFYQNVRNPCLLKLNFHLPLPDVSIMEFPTSNHASTFYDDESSFSILSFYVFIANLKCIYLRLIMTFNFTFSIFSHLDLWISISISNFPTVYDSFEFWTFLTI